MFKRVRFLIYFFLFTPAYWFAAALFLDLFGMWFDYHIAYIFIDFMLVLLSIALYVYYITRSFIRNVL